MSTVTSKISKLLWLAAVGCSNPLDTTAGNRDMDAALAAAGASGDGGLTPVADAAGEAACPMPAAPFTGAPHAAPAPATWNVAASYSVEVQTCWAEADVRLRVADRQIFPPHSLRANEVRVNGIDLPLKQADWGVYYSGLVPRAADHRYVLVLNYGGETVVRELLWEPIRVTSPSPEAVIRAADGLTVSWSPAVAATGVILHGSHNSVVEMGAGMARFGPLILEPAGRTNGNIEVKAMRAQPLGPPFASGDMHGYNADQVQLVLTP